MHAPIKRIRCGAHVRADFTDGILDLNHWQYWRWDSGVEVGLCPEGLRVQGTTQESTRAFSGLCSRQLYPADSVLICEMKVRSDLRQRGRIGAVVHLCNRLVGDDLVTLEIPDNNGEVTFGHHEGRLGWFRWYLDQSGGTSHKWRKGIEPFSPIGTEGQDFIPVRVSYSEPDGILTGHLRRSDNWVALGGPVRMRKVFSAVELKVDAAAEGLKVDVLFRNCRLFPQPARSPVRVYVGTHANPPAPLTDISVELLEPDRDRALSGGATDREGLAELSMDPDAIY
ncbi:MAG: hypothetical protein QGI83_12615, partial [Candidatus Latescibacteria bacterium]|nr:hypothetical protein [Candidatus Latescibacterota bacterium]